MDELIVVEIKPQTRQSRTHWSVQRASDKFWLVRHELVKPSKTNFRRRRRYGSEAEALEAIFDFHLAQAMKEET
jgi:hypothetical protein